jgi:hypothetical protein
MRKRWLAALAIALLLVGVIFPLLFPRPSKVTRAAYERIEKGMSREEVEAILGGPPGDYTTRPTLPGLTTADSILDTGWWGDEGIILLDFNDSGAVTQKHFIEVMKLDQGPLATWRWRFERWRDKVMGPPPEGPWIEVPMTAPEEGAPEPLPPPP